MQSICTISTTQPVAGGNTLRTLFPPDTLVGPQQTQWHANDEMLTQGEPKLRNNRQKSQQWKSHWNRNFFPFMHSSTVYDLSQAYIPIRFLHLHDQVPIRTNFLCHILPDVTPNACRVSRIADQTQPSALAHMNSGQEQAHRIWYDHLAVQAVQAGLIDYNQVSRATVTEACRQHHEVMHNRTLLDLPHGCPSRQALRALWEYSWEKEIAMLGSQQANWTRHLQIFNRNLAAGKYCNINAAHAVQQPEWRDFFQQHFGAASINAKQTN